MLGGVGQELENKLILEQEGSEIGKKLRKNWKIVGKIDFGVDTPYRPQNGCVCGRKRVEKVRKS